MTLQALRATVIWLTAGGLSLGVGSAQVNLLTNPGFESGNLQGWTLQGSGSVVSNGPRTGRYAASLTNANLRQG